MVSGAFEVIGGGGELGAEGHWLDEADEVADRAAGFDVVAHGGERDRGVVECLVYAFGRSAEYIECQEVFATKRDEVCFW